MITPDELAKAFNDAGIDTPETIAAFLKPAAIGAKLSAFDGQIAGLIEKRAAVTGEIQKQIEDLEVAREETRKKLQLES